jgi:hypothetical protein
VENISTYIKEAFITKSNIKKAAAAQDPIPDPKELMDYLFGPKVGSTEAYKKLQDVLEDQGILPDGNIFRNRNITSIDWFVVCGRDKVYSVKAGIVFRNKPNEIHNVSICSIRKQRVVAPSKDIEDAINSIECDGYAKDIIDDIYNVGKKIADFLGIGLFDARDVIKVY